MGGSAMAVDLDRIAGDAPVVDRGGEKIGIVGGIATDRDTGVRYMKVDRIGDDLYVPADVIVSAQMGDPVVLGVSKDEAIASFKTRPNIT
jgi:hypothetical protein